MTHASIIARSLFFIALVGAFPAVLFFIPDDRYYHFAFLGGVILSLFIATLFYVIERSATSEEMIRAFRVVVSVLLIPAIAVYGNIAYRLRENALDVCVLPDCGVSNQLILIASFLWAFLWFLFLIRLYFFSYRVVKRKQNPFVPGVRQVPADNEAS